MRYFYSVHKNNTNWWIWIVSTPGKACVILMGFLAVRIKAINACNVGYSICSMGYGWDIVTNLFSLVFVKNEKLIKLCISRVKILNSQVSREQLDGLWNCGQGPDSQCALSRCYTPQSCETVLFAGVCSCTIAPSSEGLRKVTGQLFQVGAILSIFVEQLTPGHSSLKPPILILSLSLWESGMREWLSWVVLAQNLSWHYSPAAICSCSQSSEGLTQAEGTASKVAHSHDCWLEGPVPHQESSPEGCFHMPVTWGVAFHRGRAQRESKQEAICLQSPNLHTHTPSFLLCS